MLVERREEQKNWSELRQCKGFVRETPAERATRELLESNEKAQTSKRTFEERCGGFGVSMGFPPADSTLFFSANDDCCPFEGRRPSKETKMKRARRTQNQRKKAIGKMSHHNDYQEYRDEGKGMYPHMGTRNCG